MLNKQATEQLKGIAIILVVVGHFFVTRFINSSNSAFNYLGAQGVAIFLILSGYGLTKSFLKRGMDKGFLVRRLRAVLLPYSLVTLLWFVLDYFKDRIYSLKTIVLSLAGFDFYLTMDATMWYITFILMWYLIYYLIFSLKLPNSLRVGLLFAFAYLFRYHSRVDLTEQVYWQWGLHAFMFPLGTLLAFVPQPRSQLTKKTVPVGLSFMGIMGLGIYSFSVQYNDLGLGPYMLSNFGFSLATLSLIIILQRLGLYSRLLQFIGLISFEIYLLEAIFMYKFSLLYVLPNKVLSCCLYITILIGASLLLKQITTLLPELFSAIQGMKRKEGQGRGPSGRLRV